MNAFQYYKRISYWDIESHLPKVAFRPDNNSDLVLAYDHDGNVEIMSTLVVPDELVITISENERLIEFKKEQNYTNGRLLLEDCPQLNEIDPYFSNNEYDYYLATDLNRCYPARILRPSEPTGTTQNNCDRDKKNTKDEIHKMRFANMEYYKETRDDAGWFDSKLEMRLTVTFATKAGAITQLNKYFGGKETNFKNCSIFKCNTAWFEMNLEIVNWDPLRWGDAMHYAWLEMDAGDERTQSINFSSTYEDEEENKQTIGVNASWKITANDDLLGESIVEYCDEADGVGEEYKTGKVIFHVKQR